MRHILHITASAHPETSASRAASAKVVANLGGSVSERNLAADPLPFVTGEWTNARLTDPATRSAADSAILALSDTLVAELRAADTIVIGTPIYNFAAPAVLKA